MFQKRLNKGVNRLNNEVLNQLPPIHSYDNGKVLKVVDGQWKAGDAPQIPNEFITHFTNNLDTTGDARVTIYRVGKMVTIKVQNWNGNAIEGATILFDYLPKPKDLTYQLDMIPVFGGSTIGVIGKVYLGVVEHDGVSVGKVSKLSKNDQSTIGPFSFEFSYFTD